MRAYRLICILTVFSLGIAGFSVEAAQKASCDVLLTTVYEGTFTVKLRGENHQIRYIKNRRQLSKNEDLVVVSPGLNKPAFEEMVKELGQQGAQAVSFDYTNINKVGPFAAPTPEEDALIQHAGLKFLKFNKRNFKKKIFLVSHSRGALVVGRFFSEFGHLYNVSGVVEFNPYVGWIPNYHEASNGQQMSSGFRLMHSWMALVPGVNMALHGMAQVMEEAGKFITRSAVNFYGDIHNKNQSHDNLKSVIKSDDPKELENIRQKLIGMEQAEVVHDLQNMIEKQIPILFVRGTDDDLVPAGMIDTVAAYFQIPVEVLEGGHYLPYSQTVKSTKIVLKSLSNASR